MRDAVGCCHAESDQACASFVQLDGEVTRMVAARRSILWFARVSRDDDQARHRNARNVTHHQLGRLGRRSGAARADSAALAPQRYGRDDTALQAASAAIAIQNLPNAFTSDGNAIGKA